MPISFAKKRAEFLVSCVQKEKGKIVIPTPAIAEVLTVIGPDAQAYFDIVAKSRLFEIASFDSKAAIELAFLNRDVFSVLDPKNGGEPYQKIKVDRQILAVLKSRGVSEICTDDEGLIKRAKLCGITPIQTVDLPVPPDEKQMKFEFDPYEEIPDAEPDPRGDDAGPA